MKEKAAQGIYLSRAPFDYLNNKGERTIEVHPVNSLIATRIFDLCKNGTHTMSTLRKQIYGEFGNSISLGNVVLILKNKFYIGTFEWSGQTYTGTHPLFIDRRLRRGSTRSLQA